LKRKVAEAAKDDSEDYEDGDEHGGKKVEGSHDSEHTDSEPDEVKEAPKKRARKGKKKTDTTMKIELAFENLGRDGMYFRNEIEKELLRLGGTSKGGVTSTMKKAIKDYDDKDQNMGYLRQICMWTPGVGSHYCLTDSECTEPDAIVAMTLATEGLLIPSCSRHGADSIGFSTTGAKNSKGNAGRPYFSCHGGPHTPGDYSGRSGCR
jgi:hypothetical protein